MGNITSSALKLTGLLTSLYILHKAWLFVQDVRAMGNHPGLRTVVGMKTFLSNALPRIPGFIPGANFTFVQRHRLFAEAGCDIVSAVSAFPTARAVVLADADAIKEVCSSRARFPKPVEQYAVLLFYGRNIVASEGEEWKRYRKISAPAFSDRNNKLVWDETCKIVGELFDTVWRDEKTISYDHCVELTLPIALFVIGVAGFGRSISWQDDDAPAPGHQLTFKEALHTVTTFIFIKVILPDWAMNATSKLKHIDLSFKELRQYMAEMIQARRDSEVKEERYDLFSSLLDAATTTGALDDDELIGNIFIFLVAGHETTAHTLSFTFGLLALHPEYQEELYQHIKNTIPDNRIPTYEEMPLLTHSLAVFYETLRLFPPVIGIPKFSAEDTVLTTKNTAGEQVQVPVPAGTDILISVPGLHHNPRYWKNPEQFNPWRFLGDWPRDAFLPFSGGARACIGRKFFETEGIAILTMLMAKYKVEVKNEPQFANESFEERKARVLKSRPGLTVTPIRMPLTFTRR